MGASKARTNDERLWVEATLPMIPTCNDGSMCVCGIAPHLSTTTPAANADLSILSQTSTQTNMKPSAMLDS